MSIDEFKRSKLTIRSKAIKEVSPLCVKRPLFLSVVRDLIVRVL